LFAFSGIRKSTCGHCLAGNLEGMVLGVSSLEGDYSTGIKVNPETKQGSDNFCRAPLAKNWQVHITYQRTSTGGTLPVHAPHAKTDKKYFSAFLCLLLPL
jgi:hypothetical protein